MQYTLQLNYDLYDVFKHPHTTSAETYISYEDDNHIQKAVNKFKSDDMSVLFAIYKRDGDFLRAYRWTHEYGKIVRAELCYVQTTENLINSKVVSYASIERDLISLAAE